MQRRTEATYWDPQLGHTRVATAAEHGRNARPRPSRPDAAGEDATPAVAATAAASASLAGRRVSAAPPPVPRSTRLQAEAEAEAGPDPPTTPERPQARRSGAEDPATRD